MIEQQRTIPEPQEAWIRLKKAQADANGLSHSGQVSWSPGSMPSYLLMNTQIVNQVITDSEIGKQVVLTRYNGSAEQNKLMHRPTFSGTITLNAILVGERRKKRKLFDKSGDHLKVRVDFTQHERDAQDDYARAAVLIEKEFVYGVQSEVMKRLIGEAKYDAFILILTTACFLVFQFTLKEEPHLIRESWTLLFTLAAYVSLVTVYDAFYQEHNADEEMNDNEDSDDSHLAARRKLLKRLLRVPLLPTIAELHCFEKVVRASGLFRGSKNV